MQNTPSPEAEVETIHEAMLPANDLAIINWLQEGNIRTYQAIQAVIRMFTAAGDDKEKQKVSLYALARVGLAAANASDAVDRYFAHPEDITLPAQFFQKSIMGVPVSDDAVLVVPNNGSVN